jgi:hypothetical protein
MKLSGRRAALAAHYREERVEAPNHKVVDDCKSRRYLGLEAMGKIGVAELFVVVLSPERPATTGAFCGRI